MSIKTAIKIIRIKINDLHFQINQNITRKSINLDINIKSFLFVVYDE